MELVTWHEKYCGLLGEKHGVMNSACRIDTGGFQTTRSATQKNFARRDE